MKLINKFIIIIPVWNAEGQILKSLKSVLEQSFDDLGIIIRDDCSTDRTPELIQSVLKIDGRNSISTKIGTKNILFIQNNTKLYGGGNTFDSVKNFVGNPDAIVGVVDGDDWLTTDLAVQKIYDIYQSSNAWQVWSQHETEQRCMLGLTGFSNPLPPDETLYSSRNYWSVSHFRTFKAWLLEKIDEKDLRDPFEDEQFCKYAGDAAFIYPLTELCGNAKSYYLNEILYHYNDLLLTNDHNKSMLNVKRYSDYIREKEIYCQFR